MHDFPERIQIELDDIDYLIKETEAQIDDSFHPDGYLEPERRGTKIIYYQTICAGKKRKRLRLGEANSPEVIKFKTQRFLRERLKRLYHDRKEVERLARKYMPYDAESIHADLPSAYKDLPDYCYEDPRFTKLTSWAQESVKTNSYPMPLNANRTCDGTEVRSKGECIGYDNLKAKGIPFRCDSELSMRDKDGNRYKICADFLFSTCSLEYFAWEHWGMLLDPQYASTQVEKLQKYLRMGFTLGDNLFITSDNAEGNTSSMAICDVIEFLKKKMGISDQKRGKKR